MSKTKIERIAGIEDRIKQLENQKKRLAQQHKAAERKARTRRLIQRGAILEGFIPEADTYTEEQIQAILQKVFHNKSTPARATSTTAGRPRPLGR